MAMRKPIFRFVMLIAKDGSPLCHVSISEECFAPAVECCQLSAVRRGELPPQLGGTEVAQVDPVWDEIAGSPHICGFRVRFPESCSKAPRIVRGSHLDTPISAAPDFIPLVYFLSLAQRAAQLLVRAGQLAEGDVFTYRVLSFRCGETGAVAEPSGIRVEEIPQALPLVDGAIGLFIERAVPLGLSRGDDMRVFIPQHILDDIADLKAKAGEIETGGILLGRLHRDPRTHDLFVEVTEQIAALHTTASSTRLTFTTETWAAVDASVRLRRKEEIIVGWWHAHQIRHWCSECPPEKLRECTGLSSLFSETDVALHTEVFPRAYSIALVVGDRLADRDEGPTQGKAGPDAWSVTHSLFGWWKGMLVERGFHVLGDSVARGESKADWAAGTSCPGRQVGSEREGEAHVKSFDEVSGSCTESGGRRACRRRRKGADSS